MFLRDLIKSLEKSKIEYAVVGGYALALHGIVRATMDVDLVVNVSEATLSKVERALGDLGLTSRLPIRAKEVAQFREEYIQRRNLIAWSFVDFQDQTRQVDILIPYDLKGMGVERMKWGGLRVSVVDLPTLLKMKLEAARPQDLIDAEKIREKIKSSTR